MTRRMLRISLIIGIITGIVFTFVLFKFAERLSRTEFLFLLICGIAIIVVCLYFIDFIFLLIFIIPLSFKEKREEALEKIIKAMKGHEYREVYYLYVNDKGDNIVDLMTLMQYSNYRFIVKLTDDNIINLIVVDKNNTEICCKEISNLLFFIEHFEFI